MNKKQCVDQGGDFALERYKYVLEQKKYLNGVSFKIVSIYQAGMALLLGGCYKIVVATRGGSLSCESADLFLRGLFLLFIILTIFSILMISCGILAWLGYRRDESDLESAVGVASKPLPRFRDMFRWYETYILLVVVVVAILFGFYLHGVQLGIALCAS
ncbi:hypothetical protein [Rhodanobacter sp. DHG33]|uniref:hypothetical protein n=1 Tax=Rhodanobacter sp. DHG33 TaxID=2775921 RepID=UPI00177B2C57|nr:hypothetical protein [Rhodanobacter sp. DHG33]MBD8899023.1 hypothetical protein [Rhodanobacter sp. DHG33]